MKNFYFLTILLFSLGASAQNLAEINADLKISDSLTYDTEVRVYRGGGITNYSSLFRMYKDKSRKWTAELYDHYAKVDGITELRIEKRILESENDMEFIFQNLVRSYLLDLPSLSEVQWKLATRGVVEKVIKTSRGKEIEEYELPSRKVLITDGEGFKVQAKAWNKSNEFEFSNPDSYLNHYPEIDELVFMCEILDIIRDEFGIWRK